MPKYAEIHLYTHDGDVITTEDEPLFVLRGQDVLAYDTIEHYLLRAETAGCDAEFLAELEHFLTELKLWQATTGRARRPD